jgi:hypothetical protein
MTSTDTTNIREAVRERYASAATHAASGAFEEARASEAAGCGCGTGGCAPTGAVADGSFGATLYGAETSDGVPARRSRPRSVAASRPRWRIYTRVTSCSISVRAPAPTC